MIALWCVIGLIVSTISVSTLGAAFSVFGLRQLFSGAALAVCAMAASLELSKFVMAAYLHQAWPRLNILLKTYLVGAVIVLSAVTSMGIFGFLSNAYQSASSQLEAEKIKLDALHVQQNHNETEVAQINKAIDEIPANRVTKRMQAREEFAPALAELSKQAANIAQQVEQSNLRILEVKQKVGPLIYISRAFNVEIDNVVKYLILVLVSVFDPLAICLVIATSESLESRKRKGPVTEPQMAAAAPPPHDENADVIHMRFADEEEDRNVS